MNQVIGAKLISKWGIFIFDLFLVLTAMIASYFLFVQLATDYEPIPVFLLVGFFCLYAITFFILKPHRVIIRYANAEDLINVLYATTLSFVLSISLTFIGEISHHKGMVPYVFVIFLFIGSTFLLLSYRLIVSVVRKRMRRLGRARKNIFIFGAGEMGRMAFEIIEKEEALATRVVGLIDDSPKLYSKKYRGTPIYTLDDAMDRISEDNVSEVILAINKPNLSSTRRSEIIKVCLNNGLLFKEMPEVKAWMEGDIKQAIKVRIKDLLERETIHVDNRAIKAALKENCVLVTGAAGSIGSEIVLQALSYGVKKIVLIDNSESPLAYIERVVLEKYPNANVVIELADVTDAWLIEEVFKTHHPKIVFHAAAYKHVPMMERSPINAIKVNVGGTKTLADLSVKYDVSKFVMVSTDKAVNPTNVMGASKRLCEIYTQSLSFEDNINTSFITTRFGNVLGSNGSVIPIFRKQIEKGGPVTVTHEEVTRFFMTIPEACLLVLEAGITGNSGEIYVFDMGKPVKIYDLAEKMIRMAGFEPNVDININITGLRPGEKLYEELLSNEENTLPTHHEKILKAKVRKYEYQKINQLISNMIESLHYEDEFQIINRIKALVPEYVSQNSKFVNSN